MTEANYRKKWPGIERTQEPEAPARETKPLQLSFEEFLSLLQAMQRPRLHLTAPPTFIPKNFAEQIQFYDDEAGTPVRRVYFYVNRGWRYVTLT